MTSAEFSQLIDHFTAKSDDFAQARSRWLLENRFSGLMEDWLARITDEGICLTEAKAAFDEAMSNVKPDWKPPKPDRYVSLVIGQCRTHKNKARREAKAAKPLPPAPLTETEQMAQWFHYVRMPDIAKSLLRGQTIPTDWPQCPDDATARLALQEWISDSACAPEEVMAGPRFRSAVKWIARQMREPDEKQVRGILLRCIRSGKTVEQIAQWAAQYAERSDKECLTPDYLEQSLCA